jgi:putative heme-binding domain-containing protein
LLRALKEAEEFEGAQYIARFVSFIRTDHLNTFTPSEQEALATEIAELGQSSKGDISAPPRPLVKNWSFDELTALLDQVTEQRDRQRGKKLFAEALCAQCHRREDLGRAIGPDLNSAAAKFSRKDLLETIVVPSKVVDGKYRLDVIETDDGRLITGQLVGGDTETLSLAPSPLDPARIHRVRRNEIVSRTSSPTSIMPEGLLSTLTQEEILDLLAFLEFGTAKD